MWSVLRLISGIIIFRFSARWAHQFSLIKAPNAHKQNPTYFCLIENLLRNSDISENSMLFSSSPFTLGVSSRKLRTHMFFSSALPLHSHQTDFSCYNHNISQTNY
ncbi:unnamed protein product [Cuscuta epithymum]|uniref:Secreted protein n=1 Tax=Cuscuta epithymum TaxID=186058 RepID=A0AAV0EZR3_9ASTE|nr:unnamed protein product [Cuscuta epithymum]